ncbi:MAG: alpha/beta fold hydrolase [Saprospiraceae bacterium]|nr:alpha/beta fold hydrolase [Saprospiraceae bacterium]
MKKLFILLLIITSCSSMTIGQKEVLGYWTGELNISGIKLRIGFNIKEKNSVLVTTMDSPDQNAFDIPCSQTSFENKTLIIESKKLTIQYTASLEGENQISGIFTQNGMEFPLTLERSDQKAETPKRPQEPQAPFSYKTEEVKFKNTKAAVELAGTLSYPKEGEAHAVVILISGSGPQNRDCFLLGHKPFLVIADHLTKQGIAVLRYDDRGVGASTGNFSAATSEDFGSDVQAAIDFLKTHDKIDPKKIGLIGHSEGGLIAPMVAAGNEDVAFVVSMAGPGMAGKDLLPEQIRLISEATAIKQEKIDREYKRGKKMFSIIAKETIAEKREEALIKFLKKEEKDITDEEIKKVLKQYTSPWFVYFMRYDPRQDWQKVVCPVLAINGVKDLQVPVDENLAGIEKSLQKAGNKDVTIRKIENQNHLFQTCTTGHPAEYSVIDETFSPKTLELIVTWINERF